MPIVCSYAGSGNYTKAPFFQVVLIVEDADASVPSVPFLEDSGNVAKSGGEVKVVTTSHLPSEPRSSSTLIPLRTV